MPLDHPVSERVSDDPHGEVDEDEDEQSGDGNMIMVERSHDTILLWCPNAGKCRS
jgi:hypothetical protein